VRDTPPTSVRLRAGDWIGSSRHGSRFGRRLHCRSGQPAARHPRHVQHELITIIEGDGSTPANTRRITEFLADEFPSLSVEVHQGGQPLYPYYFGIE